MPSQRLSTTQIEVLACLARLELDWTLTGGGALAGFHLGHRTTRDLDLFLHGRGSLRPAGGEVQVALREEGFEVRALHTSTTMQRFAVSEEGATVVVDLVAEPVANLEPPERHALAHATILVDTPQEILVNMLCALVQRSELRDLIDVEALTAVGCGLERALQDAPRKDSGFSALTLAWLLSELPIEAAGREEGLSDRAIAALVEFRNELVAKLREMCRPDAP